MTQDLKAKFGTAEAEVRASRSFLLRSIAGAAMLLLPCVFIAVVAYFKGADWLIISAAAYCLYLAYTCLSVAVTRTRLLPDRVELKGVFRTRTLPLAEVEGWRVMPGSTLRLVSGKGRRGDLDVTNAVVKNPVWLEWLEGLADLDERDRLARQAKTKPGK